ncbi:RNA pyrophosphohydrolase [Lutibaculum baratangense]|uniref:RNA pyrophosphohydrolase n=1 Tax=Lutibaculum baratangense AMV1 TaxID=631454 RepID=V4RJ40_9HYPH|nr:RNA pyrophosphohydrolase [Lutibaculum baratangense]ESR25334.1 Adenosine (5')-pentaphospho-(5'')-adenosine pyrophosphohydrolase [Lutibaculum baratangense AMV1]
MSIVEPEQLPYRPCVGALVVNRDGLIFVGHRMDGPEEPEGPGTWWQMPQGGIDEGEDPRVAVFRELYEETSIRSVRIVAESEGWWLYDLPPELQGKAWGGRFRGQKQKWYAMRFEGEESEIDVVNVPDGHDAEFDRWQWVGPDELMNRVVPFKRDVYRRIVDELVPLIR